MPTASIPSPLGFSEVHIELDEFYIRQPKDNEDFSDTLPFLMGFAFAANDDTDNLARLRITMEIESNVADLKNPMTATFFSNISLVHPELEKPIEPFSTNELPNVVKATILGISLGTIRGDLQVRLAGFELANTRIPIFNPSELIKNMEKEKNIEVNE